MIRQVTASLKYLWKWGTPHPPSRAGERKDLMVKSMDFEPHVDRTSAFPDANSATLNQLLG